MEVVPESFYMGVTGGISITGDAQTLAEQGPRQLDRTGQVLSSGFVVG